MLGLPLAFAAPLVLGALALLPALYWLLRITPPRPRQVAFPPLRLILDLKPQEQAPARTPWWLMALRLALAAAVILAMAGPIWNPPPKGQAGAGPLLVVLDNGWASAVDWDQRVSAAQAAVVAAARDGRTGAVLATSEGGREIAADDPTRIGERLRALKPVPYAVDRRPTLPAIANYLAANPGADILWIADGIAENDARGYAQSLIGAAGEKASVRVLTASRTPAAIAGVENAASGLEARLLRADAQGRASGVLRAYDLKGLSIGEAPFAFGGANETRVTFDLPTELRNEIARIDIDGERTAGAVALLDSRWKRRRVAIVSGVTADLAQPLLSPTYYVSRALAPFADVREPRASAREPIGAALDDQPALLVLADIGVIAGPAKERLARFVEDGGVLLRFAGTRLASSSDDFVPVPLRRGGRVLGGSLSWDTPRKLAPFDRQSPLYGLDAIEEIKVTRQVLAEPEAGLRSKTWAALDDGTPLITAAPRGKGMIVLVHVTADTTWSNLPLSGLFVDILRRVTALAGESADGAAQGTSNAERPESAVETVAPTRTLDGFGALGDPPITAKPVPVNFSGPAVADHPPGFYGPANAMIALNTLASDATLTPANLEGLNLDLQPLRPAEPVDLRPALIALAFLLFLADALASIWLGGGFGRGRQKRAARSVATAAALALIVGAALVATTGAPARAQEASSGAKSAFSAALRTHLAYVVTGDAAVDEASRLGLTTLSRALSARTALSPGEPIGVDPGRDELAFYPLIYWPIVANRPQPPQAAVTRIAEFMKQGGTVVFDTRDALTAMPGGPPSPETQWLRTLLAGVDVPELEPVPRDHVATKTFYLLDNFVGRTTVGQTWIEALPPPSPDTGQRPARAGDSVSPIVITSNDLAAAWAADNSGQPLYPLSPGTGRQREMAVRAGVNLVMYTLTGNYKSDQVHVRDLLDRLGH